MHIATVELQLLEALEATSLDMWRALNAHVTQDDFVSTITTKIANPYFNRILVRPNSQLSKELIDNISRPFFAKKLPFSWSIPKSCLSPAVDEALRYHNLCPRVSLTSMYTELENCFLPFDRPSYNSELVTTLSQLKAAGSVYEESYDVAPEHAKEFFKIHLKHFLRPKLPMHYYIGSIDGEVVGCAMLVLGSKAAGIYNLGTKIHARKRGIATMMLVTLLKAAQEKGYRYAVLNAMPMAIKLYQKIGFIPLSENAIYIYR